MSRLQRLLFVLIILCAASAAHAQPEQAPRTWVGGGFTFIGSTAENEGGRQAIVGFRVRAAYDIRHGFQVRGSGEWLSDPVIGNLFTGYRRIKTNSQLTYGAVLVNHLPVSLAERKFKPFAGAGVVTTRHFFDKNAELPVGYALYNSSVNPAIVAGAGLGRRSEVTLTRYLEDTYGESGLRGWGASFGHTRRLHGRLHLRVGADFKAWTYREGRHDEKVKQLSGSLELLIQ